MSVFADHLQQRGSDDIFPAPSWCIGAIEENAGCSAGTCETSEAIVAFVIRFGEPTQCSHLAHKPARGIAAFGKVGLARVQRLPDNVFQMHWIHAPVLLMSRG